MTRFISRRALVAVALIGALGAGAVLSAQRGSTAMVTAATRFLDGLTPEQRKQAVFTLDSQERLPSSPTRPSRGTGCRSRR
jgi:hypothetical protein